MTPTPVAIGLVLRDEKILISRRLGDAPLGGYWEFPGGKCEPEETPEQCVVRELLEEMGIRVVPTHAFSIIEFSYTHGRVRLHPFLCKHISGEASPLAAQELRWVSPSELPEYRFPPANATLIEELQGVL